MPNEAYYHYYTKDETNQSVVFHHSVQQLKHVLSPEPVVTELVHETAGISGSIPIKHDHFVRDQRQRSSKITLVFLMVYFLTHEMRDRNTSVVYGSVLV